MLRSLTSWRRDRDPIPLADRIVPIITQAGSQGMSRGELGRAIELERDTLDSLMDGLVRFGTLTMTVVNGVRYYRKAR